MAIIVIKVHNSAAMFVMPQTTIEFILLTISLVFFVEHRKYTNLFLHNITNMQKKLTLTPNTKTASSKN